MGCLSARPKHCQYVIMSFGSCSSNTDKLSDGPLGRYKDPIPRDKQGEDDGVPIRPVRTIRPDTPPPGQMQSLEADDLDVTLPASDVSLALSLEVLTISSESRRILDSTAEEDMYASILMHADVDVHLLGLRDISGPDPSLKAPDSSKSGCLIIVVGISNGRKLDKWHIYVQRAREVLESFLHCNTVAPRRVKILIRFNRPSTNALDEGELPDMKLLGKILDGCRGDELATIAMAGADSFTANAASFCRLFSKYSHRPLLLAVAKGTWKHYQVPRILAIHRLIMLQEPPPTTPEDNEVINLLREWTEILKYKEAKSGTHTENPLVGRESRERNRFDLPGVALTDLTRPGRRSKILVLSPVMFADRYACPSEGCPRALENIKDMLDHLAYHAEEDSNGSLLCPLLNLGCPVTFRFGSHGKAVAIKCLVEHLRRHYQDYSHGCEVEDCSWKGYNSTELKEHTNSRHLEKQYKCLICNLDFGACAGLSLHGVKHQQHAENMLLSERLQSHSAGQLTID